MKKFGLWLLLLIVLVGALATVALYRYPYLPDIVEEGFPSPVWPARGQFVPVNGVPENWPSERIKATPPRSAFGAKLNTLLVESETDALLAYHKGQLVYAYFRPGHGDEVQYNSFSMVKSLIGYLVLKAIDEGEIDSLDSPIGTYLLDLKDPALAALPIRRFLEMKSGLLFEKKKVAVPLARDAKRPPDKDANNPFTPLARLHIQGLEGVQAWLTLPPKPVFDYHYQNVNTALLGAMLSKIYNKPLNEILSAKIWRPAGASHAHWRTYSQDGAVTPYCCLFAKADDWAKVGLYLSARPKSGAKSGLKRGRAFLSQEQAAFIQAHSYAADQLRRGVYGLHVRHDILDREGEPLQGPFSYFIGHGGQLVYLKPENELVVVRFGRRHTLLHSTLYWLWREIKLKEAKAAP